MTPRLKELLENFTKALNEAITESDLVVDAFEEIQSAGYDIKLILDATVQIGVRDPEREESTTLPEPCSSNGVLQLNEQDQEFLKMLKVECK